MDNKKSYVDVAYEVLSDFYKENKNTSVPMPFGELLMAVGKAFGIEDDETLIKMASKFYTSLTIDGRFVIKENNTWVLREHEKFENVHIDMNEVYSDEDEEENSDDTEKELGEEDEKEEDEAPVTTNDEDEDE